MPPRTRLSCQNSVYGNGRLAAGQNILITGAVFPLIAFFQAVSYSEFEDV